TTSSRAGKSRRSSSASGSSACFWPSWRWAPSSCADDPRLQAGVGAVDQAQLVDAQIERVPQRAIVGREGRDLLVVGLVVVVVKAKDATEGASEGQDSASASHGTDLGRICGRIRRVLAFVVRHERDPADQRGGAAPYHHHFLWRALTLRRAARAVGLSGATTARRSSG